MWQEEAKCFGEVSPRCEGPQTHLNPGGLCLIAFDVHVNMTCFNIPALTIPSSEDQGKAEHRGGGERVVGGVQPALIGCQACLYCLGQKEYPALTPTPPVSSNCPLPNSLSFPQAPVSPLCVCVRACVCTCMYVLHCVSWHIIKGNSSERETLNREGSVP